ncbi:MAG: 6-pyruvoyl-tetrahydropterin synthase-related protein, partial [Candidatus Aenigmatarchaeota archaeon]
MKMIKKIDRKFFKNNYERIIDISLLISIFLFLLYYFKPELLLSKTSVSGGDMVSHFALSHYLKNYLIPHGKLIGWYPHWLGGLPMFQFYFILPYLVMSLLSYLIPLEISFKLISVLGIFLLPFTSYWSMKLMEFKFPTPVIAAVFSLMFLFLETNSYYGGNIPSTLAGEISYSISFSLMILFFGLLYKGVKTRKYLISNVLVLTLIILTHVYTSILMFLTSSFFILTKKLRGLRYLIGVGGLSFLLVAFWLLPFILKYNYSAAPKELLSQVDINVAFIRHYTIFYLLALLSILIGLKNRDMRIFYICFTIVIAFILLFFANKFLNLLYVRFAPFLYFFPLLLAADGLEKISLKFKRIIPIIVFLIVLFWLIKNVSYIPSWIKWNYEGLEVKSTWGELKNILDEIKKLNESGRIIIEYSAAYDKYGSPRVFEVSPVFTNKSVMEGLLLESSLTFPFYYYIQKEIAETT